MIRLLCGIWLYVKAESGKKKRKKISIVKAKSGCILKFLQFLYLFMLPFSSILSFKKKSSYKVCWLIVAKLLAFSSSAVLMSFHCRVGNSALLLRALSVLSLGRDTWATVAFTPQVVIIHSAGEDQSTTATATLPSSLFQDYHVAGEVRFMVDLTALSDALTLLGAHTVASAFVKVVLAYPTSDGRLLVEIMDQHRSAQSILVTRAVKERLLDLRFSDALTANRAIVRGDAVREAVLDLVALQCTHAEVAFRDGLEGGSPARILFSGSQSVLGAVEVSLDRTADSVLLLEPGDQTVKGKYLTAHLATAVGLHARSSPFAPLRPSSSAAGNQQAPYGDFGFEKLSLLINTERQLCVVHRGRDHDVPVAISIVITPLFAGLD
jgi:hypothetical protein